MPAPAGGNGNGSSVFRPAGPPARSRSRPGGWVWLPRPTGPFSSLLAPTTPARRKLRQRWIPAIGGQRIAPPAPLPIPPIPPWNALGLLAPVVPVRWFPRQRWIPAIGQSQVQWYGIQRPVSSPRRLYRGRATTPSVVQVPTLATPLRGLSVSIRHRWKPGQARQATALPPTGPVAATPLLGLRVRSPRRLPPGRVIAARLLPPAPPPTPITRPGLLLSSPRRLAAGRVLLPHYAPLSTPVVYPRIHRPVASPRKLTPGRVTVPKGAPAPTLLSPLHGLSVVVRHRWKAGRAIQATALPPSAPPPAPPPPGYGLLVPTSPVRRCRRQRWLPAIADVPPGTLPFLGMRPLSSPRQLRAGRVSVGRTIVPLDTLPPMSGSPVLRPVGSGWRSYPRRPWVHTAAGFMSPVPAISRFPGGLLVGRRGDRDRRDHRGWLLHWLPIPLGGPLTNAAIAYHVYGNSGGGAINYTAPLATVTGLTWTSFPLAYPDDWKFGVRAFDGYGEEQNLDCAVEIILDASGNDITNRPAAPTGLRAFALAGGAVRVEWASPVVDRATAPTGFHVYIVSPGLTNAGLLCPVSPTRRMRRQRWLAATGGSAGYAVPAATVLFATGIANTSGVNLAGLVNGMTYTIGVRAFNAVAEEPNTYTVSVTADATGPGPVDSLSGIAI